MVIYITAVLGLSMYVIGFKDIVFHPLLSNLGK